MLSLNPGRVIAGKYRLDRELAQGGMGSLWIAFDRRLRRHVAIKFINALTAQLEGPRLRFEREARAAAQIRSPHVVQIYDYGVDRGHAYIVMELLDGEDLAARFAREKRLPLATLSGMLRQIAKGLDAVHAAGIVHRDLKPANIFLAQVAGEETIKLLDFGVARAEISDGRRMTGRGTLVGTVKYMSPEQARGDTTLDYRTDLWALTVIVYRLLTGRHPFHATTIEELLVAISRDPIAPPSTCVPHLPPGVDIFFQRAFARVPTMRFHSAQQMASAFTATLTAARNGTIPWGAQPAPELGPMSESEPERVAAPAPPPRAPLAPLAPRARRRPKPAPVEPCEAERKTRPEGMMAHLSSAANAPEEEATPATLACPSTAPPPPWATLPPDIPPIRWSVTGDDAGNRWWWASVPAALVVVAAVVLGLTVRTRTSLMPAPSAQPQTHALQPPSPPR